MHVIVPEPALGESDNLAATDLLATKTKSIVAITGDLSKFRELVASGRYRANAKLNGLARLINEMALIA